MPASPIRTATAPITARRPITEGRRNHPAHPPARPHAAHAAKAAGAAPAPFQDVGGTAAKGWCLGSSPCDGNVGAGDYGTIDLVPSKRTSRA
jgi:hypothetical protein